MKLLYLMPHNVEDYGFGGAMRSNYIRQSLLAIGHVDTIVVHGGDAFDLPKGFDERGVMKIVVARQGFGLRARPERARVKAAIRRRVRDGHYDAIVARYFDLALLLPRTCRSRLILDADDFVRLLDPTSSPSAMLRVKTAAKNFMTRSIAKRVGHVWYSSPDPRQQPLVARRWFVPNVVPAPPDGPARMPSATPRILMVGMFDHPPNAEGLSRFYRDVWPELNRQFPDAELHAIGRGSAELGPRLPGVILHGFVDDLAGAYARASIVIAPIESGGGTQMKVIDALANGCAVVASAFSHAGFADDLDNGVHLLVARTPAEWTEHCLRLLGDANLANRLATAGRTIVRERYGLARMKAAVAGSIAAMEDGKVDVG